MQVTFTVDREALDRYRPEALRLLGIPDRGKRVTLDHLRAGRIIEVLMHESGWWWNPNVDHYSYGRPMQGRWEMRQALCEADISRWFGISLREVKEIRSMYRGQRWSKEDCALAFVEYFRGYKRFPGYWNLNPAEGLPTIWTLQKTFGDEDRGISRNPWTWRREAYHRCIYATWELGFLKPGEALKIRNATHRRDAVAHFGLERVLEGAHKRSEDEFGILWELPPMESNSMDRHTVYLEVVNSTPEPDGTYAKYHLRVPPNMRRPKEAVAWTFGVVGWRNFEIGVQT